MAVNWFKNIGRNFSQWSNFALDAINVNVWGNNNANPHAEKEDSEFSSAINAEVKRLHMSDRLVRSAVIAYQKGVSNTKVNIQSRSGKPNGFDEQVERLIRKASHKNHYSFNKKLGRKQSEHNQIREIVLSGGFLKIHHHSTSLKYGHAEELLPVTVIDRSHNDFEKGEYYGIRVNKKTQAITHLRLFYSTNSTTSRWVEYKNMNLVVDHWHDVNQYSAVSSLAPAIRGIKYLKAYHTEVMKGAKKRAGTPLIIFDPFYAENMKRLQKDGSKEGKQLFKEAIDNSMLNGDVFNPKTLPLGAEAKELQGSKDDPYPDLYTNQSRANSTAMGLSTSRTTGEVVSNYTANLISRGQDEEGFESFFEFLSDDCWEDDFAHMVDGFVLKGLLDVDAEHYWNNRDEYHHPHFIRRSKGHADNLKNEKAITEAKNNGTASEIELISSKGHDPEKVFRDRYKAKYLKKRIKKEVKAELGFKKKKKKKKKSKSEVSE